jgi:hypothetical protein
MQDQFDKGVGEYNRFNEVMNTQRQSLNPNDVQIVDEELGQYSDIIEGLAQEEDFRRLPTIMGRMTAEIGKKMADPNSRLVRATRSNAALQSQLAELDERYQDGDLSALDYQATKARYANWASQGFTGAGDFQSRALLNKIDLDSTIMAQVHAIKEDSQLLAPGMDSNALKASLESLQGVSSVLGQFGAPLTEANMARASYGTAALNPQVAGTKTLAETLPAENITQLGVDPNMSVDDFRALVKADTGAQISPADLVGQVDMWQSDGRGLLHKRTIETKGVTEGRIRQSVYQQLMSPENQAYLRQQAESTAILQGLEPGTAEFTQTASMFAQQEMDRLTSRAVNEAKRMDIKVTHDVNTDPTYVKPEPYNPNKHLMPGGSVVLNIAPSSYNNIGSFTQHIGKLNQNEQQVRQALRNTRQGTPEYEELNAKLMSITTERDEVQQLVTEFAKENNLNVSDLDDYQEERVRFYKDQARRRLPSGMSVSDYAQQLMNDNTYEEQWINEAQKKHPQMADMNDSIQRAFGGVQMDTPTFGVKSAEELRALNGNTLGLLSGGSIRPVHIGTNQNGVVDKETMDNIDWDASNVNSVTYDLRNRQWMTLVSAKPKEGQDIGNGDNQRLNVFAPTVDRSYVSYLTGINENVLRAHESFQDLVVDSAKDPQRRSVSRFNDGSFVRMRVVGNGVDFQYVDKTGKTVLDSKGVMPRQQAQTMFLDFMYLGN